MRSLLLILAVASVAALLMCSGDGSEQITGVITGEDDNNDDGDTLPPPATVVIRVPEDQPTIQAGIDSAGVGDTVLVADGFYNEEGNRDIEFGGKSIVLMSENGADHTIIDCGGDALDLHAGFNISMASESLLVIDGFTIRGGYHSQGVAMNFRSAGPLIKNCVIADNVGMISGGAIRCKSASPTFQNCTFVGNSAPTGAIAYLLGGSSPRFINCILAYSTGGEVIECSGNDDLPDLDCSNLYSNEGGDWIGCLTNLSSIQGNMSADPLFCDRGAGDYHLQSASPCVAENNSCNVTIGALGTGCLQ